MIASCNTSQIWRFRYNPTRPASTARGFNPTRPDPTQPEAGRTRPDPEGVGCLALCWAAKLGCLGWGCIFKALPLDVTIET